MPKRSRRLQTMARRLPPMPVPTAGNCSALSKQSPKAQASQTLELPPADYPDVFHLLCIGPRRAARGNRQSACADLRPAGSAAAERRSHRARRTQRRHLAARHPQRSVAEPPDAARSRPQSAGAARRPVGARFRARIGRARGHPHARRQAGAARRRSAPASSRDWPRSPARSAGKRRWRAAQTIRTMRARSITPPRFRPCRGRSRCPHRKRAHRS